MARLYGDALRSDGSKINGTIRISTSWNGKTGVSRNGKYSLDLGGNPKQTITAYVDGKNYAAVNVNGDTRLDIRL